MIKWLGVYTGLRNTMGESSEKLELISLRSEMKRLKDKFGDRRHHDEEMLVSSQSEPEQDEEEQDKVDEMIRQKQAAMKLKAGRISVSAESYGEYNKKGDFVAKVHEKTEDQKRRINDKVVSSFIFNSLDPKDLETVVNSMEERVCKAGENIITQGEDGEVLYVIESGQYHCFKQFVIEIYIGQRRGACQGEGVYTRGLLWGTRLAV